MLATLTILVLSLEGCLKGVKESYENQGNNISRRP